MRAVSSRVWVAAWQDELKELRMKKLAEKEELMQKVEAAR